MIEKLSNFMAGRWQNDIGTPFPLVDPILEIE